MENENKYLKERILFLEMMLKVNEKTLEKLLTTNQELLNFLKNQFQK